MTVVNVTTAARGMPNDFCSMQWKLWPLPQLHMPFSITSVPRNESCDRYHYCTCPFSITYVPRNESCACHIHACWVLPQQSEIKSENCWLRVLSQFKRANGLTYVQVLALFSSSLKMSCISCSTFPYCVSTLTRSSSSFVNALVEVCTSCLSNFFLLSLFKTFWSADLEVPFRPRSSANNGGGGGPFSAACPHKMWLQEISQRVNRISKCLQCQVDCKWLTTVMHCNWQHSNVT